MDENRYPFPLLAFPPPLPPCPATAAIGPLPDVSLSLRPRPGLGTQGTPGGWQGGSVAASPLSQGWLVMFGWAQCWDHSVFGVLWHSPPFPATAESPRPPHLSLLSLHPFLHPDHLLISLPPSLQPFWSLPSQSLRTEQKFLSSCTSWGLLHSQRSEGGL